MSLLSACASAGQQAGATANLSPVVTGLPSFPANSSGGSAPDAEAGQQAVLVHVPPPGEGDDLALADVEDAIAAVIDPIGGEVDGDEVSVDGGSVIYCYGPSADALWAAMEPVLTPLLPAGSYASKRYGGPDASASRVEIG